MAARSTPAAPLFPDPPPGGARLIRRKGHIGPVTLAVLVALGLLPLLLAASRVMALPWDGSHLVHGLGVFRDLGDFLNHHLTLDWMPAEARPKILYLLLIPTGAVMVAFMRLTLGVRVLGVRAILLAIGFRSIGVVPSLSLLAVIIVAVVVFRPWTRRIRLPLYGRISATLCLAAMIMVGALLVAPTLRSEAVWSVAFFPAIIMAMIGEAVAKTLESDDTVMAAWRVAWTIVLGLAIAAVDVPISRFTFQYPEVILSYLVLIVLIAEFLDLRLLEPWPARLSGYIAGHRSWFHPRPRVAVVRNRDPSNVISHIGRPMPEAYRARSVQPYADALREQGYEVKVIEGDRAMLKTLSGFLPPRHTDGAPGGIVLNLATGTQGDGRFVQVPAMLELAGIPYTGPGPHQHALLGDRLALMAMLDKAGIPVPAHAQIRSAKRIPDLSYPVSAWPRHEPDARRAISRDRAALASTVRAIREEYAQPTVVEEIVQGRQIDIAMLGNQRIECLPLVRSGGKKGLRCPARLPSATAKRVRACARAAFRAAGCRDYGRVRVRLVDGENPVVIDVRWVPSFGRSGIFATAADAAGYSKGELLHRVLSEAAARYAKPAEPEILRDSTDHDHEKAQLAVPAP